MNTSSESLLSAVDILVDKALSRLTYDRTITAEVYSIVNIDTGEYKVKYSGNIVSAFANDVEKLYKVGDNVYVTIPQDNLSNKKIIIGAAGDLSLSYSLMLSLSNSISEASPTFDTMYGYNATNEYGVIAGAPVDSELGYNIIYDGSEYYYHGLFLQYSKNYNLIRIRASFLTRFHYEHSQGNYGIEVLFYTKSGSVASYKLDLNSFTGDPYSLSVYSPQSVIIKAQENYLTGLKLIKLFQENFVYDRYVEAGLVTDRENTDVPNIFVKDISIQFVELRDLTGDTYYLDISLPQGNSFTSSITSLDLVGRLIYQGENLMSESTCLCSWFERDLSVLVGSELYNKNAGAGWTPVAASDFNTVTLAASNVTHQKQYKLVVVYNNNITMTAETTIYNLNSPYDFSLVLTTVGEDIALLILNNADDTVLIGDWYMLYPDGSYSQVVLGENSIIVTELLLYSSIVFYCGVYNTTHTEIIGVLEHTITSSESEDDITITYTGEDTFRYDANGDIAIEDAEKERTLLVVLTWRDGVGTSYRVEWIGPDGNDITGTRYTPNLSMIENLWVDNNNILHYTIKLKYKVNYNNNTITVRIITIDNEDGYTFLKEILFLKDGDLGTNGTTYVTAVRPFDQATGLKLSGLVPLIYRNNTWQNTLPIRCYVYKDGELINESGNYTLTYKWTGINISLSNGASDDIKIASGLSSAISGPAGAYVKVLVTINDNMNGRTYDIYCSYPIDIAVGFTDAEIATIDISSIPSYVKYTASGVNPSFYSNNIEFIVGSTDYSRNITSLETDILTIQSDDGLYYLNPASSFIFEDNTIALLRCLYSSSKYLYHPVILYLDTYGNEAINGWDGTLLYVDEENKEYVLAPLIGAGEKDSYNRFTGVVMGKDSAQDKVGLYGYQTGVNTFGLMEDGTAFFGSRSGGGLININGNTALIYGGGTSSTTGGNATNGMTITLANLNPSGTTNAIRVGNGVFTVNYNGAVTATSATISGTIYALRGKIGCTSRTSSDGWTIETNRLYSGSGSTRVELNSLTATNTSTPTNNNDFAIWAGSATASSAKFSVSKGGLITAREGNIGGWILSSNKLTSDNYRTGMASSGTYRFWAGGSTASTASGPVFSGSSYFYVTSSGEMVCRNALVNGNITATGGTIGDWIISNGRLQNSSGTVYLSSSGGLQVGNNFRVSSSGTLTANNANINGTIDAESGYIGGWRIASNYIRGGSTYLYSDGEINCDNLVATNADISGDINATSLSCNNGSIGGWVIGRNYLSGSNTYLNSNGYIETNYVDIYNQLNGTYLGTLGLVTGADDWGVTYNIGIETTSGSRSIILQSARNIALRADGAGIWITAERLVWNGADLEDIIHDIAYEVASDLIPSGGGGTTG